MALANTLSVLLNFKTDLSGLAKFSGFLNGRVKEVEEFNKKLQNGTAAINSALQAGAAYLGVQALRDYSREAIQARQTQAQLAQALKQTKQNTADYRDELEAQAGAFQRLTGLEDDQIAAVQRQLVFAGVQRKDMADLTRLTLDFAAAKEIDAVSAAKAVGRAVQGEGDELARYGVVVDTTRDKIAALRDGLGKFAGQSGVAFGALPEGLRELSVAAKEGKQSFGELVLEISNPLLQGFADAINRGTQSLNRMREEGSATVSILSGISQTIGTVVSVSGDKLVLLVAGLLALKATSLLTSQALSVLASGFMLFTGQNMAQVLANVWELSRGIGVLRALSAMDWAAKLAVGIAAIGGALAVLGIGSVLINSVEAAQLARLEREQKIREEIQGQTRALVQQASAVKSFKDVSDVRAEAQRRVNATQAEIAALEAKQLRSRRVDAKTGAIRDGSSPEDADKLKALREALVFQKDSLAKVSSDEWARERINRNFLEGRSKEKPATDQDRSRRAELNDARDLFSLETAIQQAKESGDFAQENRLTRLRDEFKLKQSLLGAEMTPAEMQATAEAIQRRLELEEQLRAKEHERAEKQRAIFALETQVTEAEAAGNLKLADTIREQIKAKQLALDNDRLSTAEIERRLAAERALTDHRAQIAADEQRYTEAANQLAQQKAVIENNALLTEQEKIRQLIPLNQRLIDLIEARKSAIQTQLATANGEAETQLRAKIDELNATIAKLKGENQGGAKPTLLDQQRLANQDLSDPSKHYQNAGDGIQGGAIGALNNLGTMGDDAASTINDGLNAALNSTQGLLFNLSTGAMGFREAWGQAITQVGQQFLQSATMMVAKMIWRATVERALVAMGVTLHVGGEQAKTGATLLGGAKRLAMTAKEAIADVFHGAVAAFKALASIPYVGPILGAAAMAAALAGGMALVKNIGGHLEGGIVHGGRQLSWLNEDGRTESVLNADATAMLGHDFINRANAGAFDFRALPAQLVAGLSLPRESAPPARSRAGGARSAAQSLLDEQNAPAAGGFHGNVIVAMGEDYLHDAMASSTGRTIILRSTARDRRSAGIPT